MGYSIPIEERDFMAAMNVALTSTGSDEEKKKKLYKELDKIAAEKQSANGFEKLSYNPPTDDEINDTAEKLSEKQYAKEIEKYLENYTKKAENTATERENAVKTSEIESEKVNENYQASKKESENQALKRGLGRSTVIMNLLQNYENGKNSNLKDIESNLNDSLKSIDRELNELESKKQQTMNNLEIEKSISIAEKIADLKAAREKKVAEVTKFNNDVNEKIIKHGSGQTALTAQQTKALNFEKANKILEYYSGYSAKDTFEDFSNDTAFKEYLGEYYNEIYQLLKSKAKNSK